MPFPLEQWRDTRPPTWTDDDEDRTEDVVEGDAPIAVVEEYCVTDERAQRRRRPLGTLDYFRETEGDGAP